MLPNQNNKRVLFNRGDRFNYSNYSHLGSATNISLGAYGVRARPFIQYVGAYLKDTPIDQISIDHMIEMIPDIPVSVSTSYGIDPVAGEDQDILGTGYPETQKTAPGSGTQERVIRSSELRQAEITNAPYKNK